MGLLQLQEALVTLATLLPEGPEQDSMYARYISEGGILDEQEGQDTDEAEAEENDSESEV